MNESFESFLREHPLHSIPDSLDRRVLELLDESRESRTERGLQRRVPVWMTLAFSMLVGLVSAWVGHRSGVSQAVNAPPVVTEQITGAAPVRDPSPARSPRPSPPVPPMVQTPERISGYTNHTAVAQTEPPATPAPDGNRANTGLWARAKARNIQSSREQKLNDLQYLARRVAIQQLLTTHQKVSRQ